MTQTPLSRLRRGLSLLLALTGPAQAVPVARAQPAVVTSWPAQPAGELLLSSGPLHFPVPIDPEGRFTLLDPPPEGLADGLKPILSFFKAPTVAPNCTGRGSAVPTNARYALFALTTPQGEEVRYQTADGQGRALLLYLTRPSTLRGTITCANDVYHVSGTYHAGLVLVPMQAAGPDETGKTVWRWNDLLNMSRFQWTRTAQP